MPWGGCLTAWIKWIGNMMQFLIFDADNLVHPQFMLEMNDHLEKVNLLFKGILTLKTQQIHGLRALFQSCSGWLTICGI